VPLRIVLLCEWPVPSVTARCLKNIKKARATQGPGRMVNGFGHRYGYGYGYGYGFGDVPQTITCSRKAPESSNSHERIPAAFPERTATIT